MKFSYNWLKELSGTKKLPSELAELLELRAFEVEGIEKTGRGLEKVIVAKILEIKKHPNADKLSLVKLAIDNARQTEVVCGAANIKVGDKVPLALPGAKLSNGMEIKEAEIRSIKSSGMLCAEDELGLGDDHSGILILDKGAKIGKLLKDELELEDFILDIKITANRAHDCLSYVGIAREICAIEGRRLKHLGAKLLRKAEKENLLKIEIKDRLLCPRYMAVILTGVKVLPSPLWVQARLRASGIRPINNIVDATNYVMLELGQPMHAFDLDKILLDQKSQAKIIVRRAEEGEKIKLLDGNVKTLSADDLVIANEKQALALAGIMGGEDSAISQNTKTIILESANFNPATIRRSRMRLGLKTDASERFEKGLDPNLAEASMARAVQIIKEFGGKIAAQKDVYPTKVQPWKIKLNLNYVKNLLGENIPAITIKNILKSLEIKVIEKKSLKTSLLMDLEIPTQRLDLKTEEDIIEEIGRLYGYEKIQPQAPKAEIRTPTLSEDRQFSRLIKRILTGKGFSEVYNYSFYSRRDAGLSMLADIEHLEVENPMNPDQALMRLSLIPHILKNVRENLKRYKDVLIFELGKVYWPQESALPQEKLMLVGAVHSETKRYTRNKRTDTNFYEAKGYVDALLEMLGIKGFYFDDFQAVPSDTPLTLWHESRTASIAIEGSQENIGFIGEINPIVLANFEIGRRVAVFELDFEKLKKLAQEENEYQPIRKYPDVTRDISMITSQGVLVDEILRVMQKAGGDLLLDADLFDIYDFEDGTSSYAFHLIFGAQDRTLEGKEVDLIMRKIVDDLEKKLKVRVRK